MSYDNDNGQSFLDKLAAAAAALLLLGLGWLAVQAYRWVASMWPW